MKYSIPIFTLILLLTFCNRTEKKEIILLANREAPLGWVYLRIYRDKTFEFESRGIERRGDIYGGTVELKNDTLYFKYSETIPKAGNKAVLRGGFVLYFGGKYPERLELKKNKFKTK